LELFMCVWPPRPLPPLMRTLTLVCVSILLVVAAAFPLGGHSLGPRHSAPAALQEESITVPTKGGAGNVDNALLPRIPSKPPVQPPRHFDHPRGPNQHGSGVRQAKWFQKVDYRRDLLPEDFFDGANYEVRDSPASTSSTPPATIESYSSLSSQPSSSSAAQRIAVSKGKNDDEADSANRWEHQDYDWR
jgi:hypothetical protein